MKIPTQPLHENDSHGFIPAGPVPELALADQPNDVLYSGRFDNPPPHQSGKCTICGHNLILLHWNLRQAGWLEQPEQSTFYRSTADFQTFIEQNCAQPSISKTNTNTKPETYPKPQLGESTTKSASVNEKLENNDS